MQRCIDELNEWMGKYKVGFKFSKKPDLNEIARFVECLLTKKQKLQSYEIGRPSIKILTDFHVTYKLEELIKQVEPNFVNKLDYRHGFNLLVIYLKYWLKEKDSLISVAQAEKIADKLDVYELKSRPQAELSKLEKYGILNQTGFLYLQEDKEKLEEVLENLNAEFSGWEEASKIVFKPLVEVIAKEFKKHSLYKRQYHNGVDFYMQYNLEQHERMQQVRSILNGNRIITSAEEYGVSEIHFLQCFGFDHIVLIKNNMIACVPVCVGDGKIKVMYDERTETVYGARLILDDIEIEEKQSERIAMDASIPMRYEKTSVVAHAMLGGLVGGTVGSLLGAQYAVQKNAQSAQYMQNRKPIYVSTGAKEVTMWFNMQYPKGEKYHLTIDTFLEDKKIVNNFFKAFNDCHSQENIIQGKLVKQYLKETRRKVYKEKEFQDYIQEKKKERRELYWSEHQERKTEIENEMLVLEKQINLLREFLNNEKQIIEQMKKKSLEISERKRELQEMNPIIRIFQKKKIECAIEEAERQYKEDDIKAQETIGRLFEEYMSNEMAVDIGKKAKKTVLQQLKKKYDSLSDELTKDR